MKNLVYAANFERLIDPADRRVTLVSFVHDLTICVIGYTPEEAIISGRESLRFRLEEARLNGQPFPQSTPSPAASLHYLVDTASIKGNPYDSDVYKSR